MNTRKRVKRLYDKKGLLRKSFYDDNGCDWCDIYGVEYLLNCYDEETIKTRRECADTLL